MTDDEIANKIVDTFAERINWASGGSEVTSLMECFQPHVVRTSTYVAVLVGDHVLWDCDDEHHPSENDDDFSSFSLAFSHAEENLELYSKAIQTFLVPF